jgi:ribosomal protein S18 acetylase RimI-like enzyme
MEYNLAARNAEWVDMDEIMRVEREAWPPEIQAPREKFESRLRIFPKGFFVGMLDGKIMGASTSEIIPYDPSNPPEKWEGITDNGWIIKTHKPKGNALYVVSIGVSPDWRCKGLGSMLVQSQKKLVWEMNLDCLVLGARCPEYSKQEFDGTPVEQYVQLRRPDGKLRDMELRFYEGNGLKVVKPVAHYMDEDPECRHYGVVMSWSNHTAGK